MKVVFNTESLSVNVYLPYSAERQEAEDREFLSRLETVVRRESEDEGER